MIETRKNSSRSCANKSATLLEDEVRKPHSNLISLVCLVSGALAGVAVMHLSARSYQDSAESLPLRQDHGERERAPLLDDLVGCEDAKEKLRPYVATLRHHHPRGDLPAAGGWPPSGLVLHGPEGTGKRTAARAVANEAGAEFHEVDLEEMALEGGRLREPTLAAPPLAPLATSVRGVVVYVARADAFLPDSYGQGDLGSAMKTSACSLSSCPPGRDREGAEERRANQRLLQELMRAMEVRKKKEEEEAPKVLLILSTRRRLVRPRALVEGFEQVQFRNPDTRTRALLFARRLPRIVGKPPSDVVSSTNSSSLAGEMARMTHGLNGRDISRICKKAVLKSLARKDLTQGEANAEDVKEAVEEEKENKPVLREWERQTVAYHEAGHAVVSWKLKHADEMMAVSIVPDSDGALGYTQYNSKNNLLHTDEQVFAKICVALAGRYSEQYFMKRLTTGARDDLQKVTALAYYSVASYGFDRSFISYDDLASFRRIYGPDVANKIDADVKTVVAKASSIARTLVKQHWDSVDKIAQTLLERDVLTFHDMQEILGPSAFIPKGAGDVGTSQLPAPVAAAAAEEKPPSLKAHF